MHLAFILLPRARLPRQKDIVRAFRTFAPDEWTIRACETTAEDPGEEDILQFELHPSGQVFVALMPAPVPNNEADRAARYSLSSFGEQWEPPAHVAHLLVTLNGDKSNAVDSLSRFTSVLAAVIKSSDALGIYWGNAGATHKPEFFLSISKQLEIVPRIMLWTGISIAREVDGRLCLLSLAMRQQLGLPDLLLTASKGLRR